MAILYAEAAAAFEDLTLSDADDLLRRQDDGAWPNTFRRARFLSAVDHVQADRLRYRVMQALDGAVRAGRRDDRAVHDRADADRDELHRPSLPAAARRATEVATRPARARSAAGK